MYRRIGETAGSLLRVTRKRSSLDILSAEFQIKLLIYHRFFTAPVTNFTENKAF